MLEDLSQRYKSQLDSERKGKDSAISTANCSKSGVQHANTVPLNPNPNTAPPVFKRSWPVVYKLEVVMKKSIYGYYVSNC